VPEIYRSGDKAPYTGIYKAIHAMKHEEPHYVIAILGDTFPPCLECADDVRFELAISSVHVNAHHHFNRSV
jgi:hypothetical protein